MMHPGELLSAYFDDELAEDERASVAAHLQSCGECRDELDAVQAAAVAVRSLPELEVPPGLVPTPAPWQRRRRWQTFGAIAAGATAVVALVVGVAVIGGDSASDTSDTVLVALEGLDSVPVGDVNVSGAERAQALDAALKTMDGVDEMAMATRDMDADADVMMGDQPMKVHSGLWYAVAEEYVALMTPDGEIAGLWVATESGTPMAFFYCEHSWYRVESNSGAVPDPNDIRGLRPALGCSG